jgi:two-component system sensor histidine kinase UhpB
VRIRIAPMWQRLPLRARLSVLLGLMFVAALLFGSVALQLFSVEQIAEESGPAARSAQAVAEALNAGLQSSSDPRQTLDAFGQTLGSSGTIQFRPAGPVPFSEEAARFPHAKAPQWFADLLTIPQTGASFPIMVEGKRAGDIVFSPDVSWEIYEKWIGFLAMIVAAAVLTLTTGIIAYFTVGTALRPLEELAAGLTRMRSGDYSRAIPVAGPPEIRRSCQQANDLARRLNTLSIDNRDLLRKIVSLQDDERRDIARELHDELGPLLFGIRAGVIALSDSALAGRGLDAAATDNILQSVEALQQANRRILDHLRPLHIQELGLVTSIGTFVQHARVQSPSIAVSSRIDPRLDELDGPLSQTVYRVIQESVTNALRHAKASSIDIDAQLNGSELTVETSDDGIGFAEARFGRGLTGMQERVRALSGTFEVLREGRKSLVRCRLPVMEAARGTEARTLGREPRGS